jgi:hypothetical protein
VTVASDIPDCVELVIPEDVGDDFERSAAVFVYASESVEDRKGHFLGIPSLVRLKTLDRGPVLGAETLDLRSAARDEIGCVGEDWEVAVSVRGTAEGRSEIVERAAQSVRDLTDDRVEDGRRSSRVWK